MNIYYLFIYWLSRGPRQRHFLLSLAPLVAKKQAYISYELKLKGKSAIVDNKHYVPGVDRSSTVGWRGKVRPKVSGVILNEPSILIID